MARCSVMDFATLRLHANSDRCWAVIERPSGAIALDKNGDLVMKLTHEVAEAVATAMTAALGAGEVEATEDRQERQLPKRRGYRDFEWRQRAGKIGF